MYELKSIKFVRSPVKVFYCGKFSPRGNKKKGMANGLKEIWLLDLENLSRFNNKKGV